MNDWLYQRLLLFYPQDLRREFGAEMALAFVEDIKNMGGVRVWWCAIHELLNVALPGQRSNPSVLVPVFSFALTALTESAELWLGSHQAGHVAYPPIFDWAVLVIFPSLLNASVGLVVTRFYARCSFIQLRLLN
jgi:hypothetical protein